MKKTSYVPSSVKEIAKLLGPKPNINEKNVSITLNRLLTEGKIAIDKKGCFYLPQLASGAEKTNEVTGTFQANKKGFGFVITDKFDVYIKSTNTSNAMNGDLVRSIITRRRQGLSFEGKIIKILERATNKIIGRLESKAGKQFVFPSDRRINYIFESVKKVEEVPGTIVEANITDYPLDGLGKCKIINVIGNEEDPDVEVEMIIREHDLRVDFPKETMIEASSVPREVSNRDVKNRKDYRDNYVITIDGLDAKDFDDAVQIEKQSGFYELKVHIADVSHYVKESSALDNEASLRSFSTYLADRVLPMLPPELSNNICSLNPGVDRLTMSVEMTISKNGFVESFSINEGVIRSKARLTYTEVDKRLNNRDFENEKQKQTLELMAELSDILEEKRMLAGSINFETIEPKVILDKNRNPVEIIIREKTPSTKLIEEAMVLTNEVIAGFVFNRELPLIYRIHENPAEDALEEVKMLLGQLGYPSKKIGKATSENFQNILKFAHHRKDRLIINSILLRLMKKARYSIQPAGHFGLGLNHYSHFTSPIRRYPDLLVHRQVKSLLNSEKHLSKILLSEHATQATLREIESDSAERESSEVYVCKLMEKQIGEIFKGVISSITNFGVFVQLPNSAEGLVHISNIKGDYYRFEPERFLLRGLRTGQVFRLGQSVKVKLVKVVVGERQIDLMLV